MSDQPELNALLTEARRIQVAHGFCKSRVWDPEDRVCMNGALIVAVTGWEERSAFNTRATILTGMAARAMGFDGIGEMCHFNNLPDTTLADVLDRFNQGIQATAPDTPLAA